MAEITFRIGFGAISTPGRRCNPLSFVKWRSEAVQLLDKVYQSGNKRLLIDTPVIRFFMVISLVQKQSACR